MARTVGPELDDLQRLLRRLQLDESERPAGGQSASPRPSVALVTTDGSRDLSRDVASAGATQAEARPSAGDTGPTNSVQTTLAELVEVRTPRPLALQRDEAPTSSGGLVPVSGVRGMEDGDHRNLGRLLFGIALASIVSTAASVGLVVSFTSKPPPAVLERVNAESGATGSATEAAAQKAGAPAVLVPSPIEAVRSRMPVNEEPVIARAEPLPAKPAAPAPSGEPSLPTSSAVAQTPSQPLPGSVSPSPAPSPPAPLADLSPPAARPAPPTPPTGNSTAIPGPLKVPAMWIVPPDTRGPLPFVIAPDQVDRTQLLVTGLETNAFVGNGLEILPGTWLIEGRDVKSAWLERGPAARANVTLDLQLRSLAGQLLARDRTVLTNTWVKTTP